MKCPVECQNDKGYYSVLINKLDREECLDVHQQTPEETTAAAMFMKLKYYQHQGQRLLVYVTVFLSSYVAMRTKQTTLVCPNMARHSLIQGIWT
jgi:hypothetical protein